MSEITTRIDEFVKDGKGWDKLVDWLAHYDYKSNRSSARYDDPDTTATDEADWDHLNIDGSWDEVQTAANVGKLSPSQYDQIVEARHAATHPS